MTVIVAAEAWRQDEADTSTSLCVRHLRRALHTPRTGHLFATLLPDHIAVPHSTQIVSMRRGIDCKMPSNYSWMDPR